MKDQVPPSHTIKFIICLGFLLLCACWCLCWVPCLYWQHVLLTWSPKHCLAKAVYSNSLFLGHGKNRVFDKAGICFKLKPWIHSLPTFMQNFSGSYFLLRLRLLPGSSVPCLSFQYFFHCFSFLGSRVVLFPSTTYPAIVSKDHSQILILYVPICHILLHFLS